MRISAIEIENFKGFGERQRIELSRINLLFGPNSAGKSTVLQALSLLRDVFTTMIATVEFLPDSDVDLGGYRQAVHMHDTKKEIGFLIEISQDESDHGVLSSKGGGEFGNESIAIGVTLRHTNDNMGFVSRFQVLFDGELAVSFSLRKEQDFKHANLHGSFLFDCEAFASVLSPFGNEIDTDFHTIVRMPSAMPDCNRAPLWFWDADSNKTIKLPESNRPLWEMTYFHSAGVVPLFREMLRSVISIGPLRKIPKPDYSPQRHPSSIRWRTGMAAWDVLHWEKEELIDEVNRWLGEKCLNTNIAINRQQLVDCRYPMTTDGKTVVVQGESTPRIRLSPTNQSGESLLRVQDVGTGLSQVVPVVVACLIQDVTIVAIEQPELHLHPKLQANLGDLFIAAIDNKQDEIGRQLLIETHSEHLILRLLRRIRETSEEELTEESFELVPEDVAVNYFMAEKDGTKVVRLRINGEGEFIDRWPYGFFDERLDEFY